MHVNYLLFYTVNQCCHSFCGVLAPRMRQNTTAFQHFPIFSTLTTKCPDTYKNIKVYMIGKVDNIVLEIATEFEIR